MHEEPMPSNRGSSRYKQIYPDPDLPVQCIKVRTIFLICAFALVLQVQGTQEGWVGRGSSPGLLGECFRSAVALAVLESFFSSSEFHEPARQPRPFSLGSSSAMQPESCSWAFSKDFLCHFCMGDWSRAWVKIHWRRVSRGCKFQFAFTSRSTLFQYPATATELSRKAEIKVDVML